MDRMQACGVCDAGSIPAGVTIYKWKKIGKFWACKKMFLS